MFDQKKIKTLLDKINWLANSFQENEYKNVSALEKSLLKEKVLMFYDEIQNIPTSLTKERTVTEIKKQEEQKVESVLKESVPKEEVVIEPEIVDIFEELEPEKVKVEKVEIVEKIVEPVLQETKAIEISKEEKFKNTEAFQKQVAMPKRDMREIIDLNKSFILKAELFSQNNDNYNQFLNELNLTRTEEKAQAVLNIWTKRLNWPTEENKAYDLIVRAIEKRFLPLI